MSSTQANQMSSERYIETEWLTKFLNDEKLKSCVGGAKPSGARSTQVDDKKVSHLAFSGKCHCFKGKSYIKIIRNLVKNNNPKQVIKCGRKNCNEINNLCGAHVFNEKGDIVVMAMCQNHHSRTPKEPIPFEISENTTAMVNGCCCYKVEKVNGKLFMKEIIDEKLCNCLECKLKDEYGNFNHRCLCDNNTGIGCNCSTQDEEQSDQQDLEWQLETEYS
jgi:hypothetical protein